MARNNFIWDFFNVITTAKSIRQDEEKREKSVRFGITGIIFSLISVALAAGAALLLSLLAGGDSNAMLLLIFTVAGLAVCAGGMLLMFIGALLRVIAQLTINKKPIGWVALAIFLACVIVSVVLFIVLV